MSVAFVLVLSFGLLLALFAGSGARRACLSPYRWSSIWVVGLWAALWSGLVMYGVVSGTLLAFLLGLGVVLIGNGVEMWCLWSSARRGCSNDWGRTSADVPGADSGSSSS